MHHGLLPKTLPHLKERMIKKRYADDRLEIRSLKELDSFSFRLYSMFVSGYIVTHTEFASCCCVL